MTKGTFYITTPIYYPSDNLHIGHAYTTVAADAIARYKRLTGYETWFLTGTDEHGQKIERKAKAAGKTPKVFVDEIVEGIKKLWTALNISYDDFIRTTEPRHKERVQVMFKKIYDQGDIYKSEYQGWYCTPCETFWLEGKLKDGACPDCGRPVEWTKEESYFFKLSKYSDRLLQHIEENPDFIQPASRRNEMVSFIKQGLEDLCVSRTTFNWGIPVPINENHVIYVWFDALSNYATALGYPDGERYKKFWPCDVHLVGKEILRFHTIIWPITLMALGEPLPKKVFGHGWLLFGAGEKMSKSRGNVVDPLVLIDRYGLDAVRYYLLREVPFGADGNYTEDALVLRTNVDLANDLGNLLSRTTAMIEKFSGGVVPELDTTADDGELRILAGKVVAEIEDAMSRLELSNAIAAIWKLVDRANKYIEERAPWALARDPQKKGRLSSVLYNLAETLRLTGILLVPYLVTTPEKIWAQLGLDADVRKGDWDQAKQWGGLAAGTRIRRGEPIFPRIEAEEAAPAAETLRNPSPAAASVPRPDAGANRDSRANPDSWVKAGNVDAAARGKNAESPVTAALPAPGADDGLISIDDFKKVDLRVAEILSAERVAGADKLLKLQLKVGEETRQIVSGIAQHYSPEDLPGKKIILVANLKPAKIRGIESFGMLLAASNEEGLTLLTVDRDIANGSRAK